MLMLVKDLYEELRDPDLIVASYLSSQEEVYYDDPPAIFIAWPQVARVVSAKFIVPPESGPGAQPKPDVMSSLRLWTRADVNR